MIYFNSIKENIYKLILIRVINYILLRKSTINTSCHIQYNPGNFSFYKRTVVVEYDGNCSIS